jgi:hypothetical protein
MKSLFVHIGGNFPEYHKYALQQAYKYSEPICIDGQLAIDLLSRNVHNQEFTKHNFLNSYGLGDFWSVTLQRFFVIEQYMIETGLDNFFHIENDNMIYQDLEEVKRHCSFDEKSIVVNPLTLELTTASCIYIPSLKLMNELCEKFVEYIKLGTSILSIYVNSTMVNEMLLLNYIYRKTEIISNTWVIPNGFYNYIFDPASYGQFLGGTPMHSAGFLDSRHLPYNTLQHFKVEFEQGKPVMNVADIKYKFVNLHIHSKKLEGFAEI